MKNKIVIAFLVLILFSIVGVFIYFNKNKEEIVPINNVSFTLNDIANNFKKLDYAKNNKCKVKVLKDQLQFNCNKKEYIFNFDGIELSISSSDLDLELIKYLVNTIENLHGYKEDEYLDTITRFLEGKINVAGLILRTQNKETYFKVVVNEKLKLEDKKEIIKNETIKEISDVNYNYENDDCLITNISLVKDEKYYIFTGTYSGDLNKNFNIKFYDKNKNLIKKESVAYNTFNTYGNKVLNYVFNTTFSDNEINNVSYYSIFVD